MELKTKQVELRILHATKGVWITNKDNTLFTKEVYLGAEDSADNYHEIAEEHKLEIEREIEIKRESEQIKAEV